MNSRRKKRFRPMAFIASLLLVASANGDVIVGNFGPADLPYNSQSAWAVYGSDTYPCCGNSVAVPFTPVGDWSVTQIDAAFKYNFGTNAVNLSLSSDVGGIPGDELASWNLVDFPPFFSCCRIETVIPSSEILLTSGSLYWLVASAGGSDTNVYWNMNNTGSSGNFRETLQVGGWGVQTGTLPVFDIQGNQITPEPGSFIMLAIGSVVILAMIKLPTLRAL
jgi:hypothetical protein